MEQALSHLHITTLDNIEALMTRCLGLWASILNYGNEEGLGMKGMWKRTEKDGIRLLVWQARGDQFIDLQRGWASFTLRQPSAGVVDTFIVSIGSP